MKPMFTFLAALTLAATSLAQGNPAPQKPAAPAQRPPAAAPQTPDAAPKTQKAPEAKSQEEFKAYQDAAAAGTDTAADDFAKKYPASELRTVLYGQLLQKAYESGNNPQIIALGRKQLAVDPENPMPLVVTGTAIAETTRDTDLDAEQKSAEANGYLDKALKNVETMLPQPGVTPEQFQGLQAILRNMAFAARGYMDMSRKDYATAEVNFQKAIEAVPSRPDPALYLRLAVVQDNLRKFAPAYANATKAMELAQQQNNTVVANLARGERDRVQKLMGTAKPAAPKQ